MQGLAKICHDFCGLKKQSAKTCVSAPYLIAINEEGSDLVKALAMYFFLIQSPLSSLSELEVARLAMTSLTSAS